MKNSTIYILLILAIFVGVTLYLFSNAKGGNCDDGVTVFGIRNAMYDLGCILRDIWNIK